MWHVTSKPFPEVQWCPPPLRPPVDLSCKSTRCAPAHPLSPHHCSEFWICTVWTRLLCCLGFHWGQRSPFEGTEVFSPSDSGVNATFWKHFNWACSTTHKFTTGYSHLSGWSPVCKHPLLPSLFESCYLIWTSSDYTSTTLPPDTKRRITEILRPVYLFHSHFTPAHIPSLPLSGHVLHTGEGIN